MKNLEMEVVDIRKMTGSSKLKASADVKVGGCLVIKGFSVFKDDAKGVSVAMPKKQIKDGRWFEMVTPTSDEIREQLQDLVMEAYDRQTDEADN